MSSVTVYLNHADRDHCVSVGIESDDPLNLYWHRMSPEKALSLLARLESVRDMLLQMHSEYNAARAKEAN